jgi:hypothetical protein
MGAQRLGRCFDGAAVGLGGGDRAVATGHVGVCPTGLLAGGRCQRPVAAPEGNLDLCVSN